MNEMLKTVIKKVIEMKCSDVLECNFEDMAEKEKSDYRETQNKKLNYKINCIKHLQKNNGTY